MKRYVLGTTLSLLLIIRGALTPIKKLLSFIIFPFVYPLRHIIFRPNKAYSHDQWQVDEVLKHNKGIKLFIWFFFDDSIYSDYKKDYHPTKHKSKIFEFLGKLFHAEDFFNSWYWAGLRNSTNNLSHFITYKFIGKLQKEDDLINTKHIKYSLRHFDKAKIPLPYLEIDWSIKDKSCYLNIGWLRNGKFEGPKIRCRSKK